MRLKSLIRKSVPKVPTDESGQKRRFSEAVADNLDTLTGRRGNVIDRAVTFRDLLDVGVLKLSRSLATYGSGSGFDADVVFEDDGSGVAHPATPTTLQASGGFVVIQLNWGLSRYEGHAYIEIFRAQKTGSAVPTLSDAQSGGVFDRYYGDAYFYQDLRVSSNQTFYYWVRAVNKNGVVSGFSNAANATTAIDYIHVSGLIDDILDDNVNTLGLNTAIANASGGGAGTPAVWNSSTTYAKDKYVTHNGKIWKASQSSTNQTPSSSSSYWTEVGTYSVLADFVSATQDQNVSTLSTLDTTYYTITETTNAITQATTNLASQTYVQTQLGSYTNTADLQLNYYTKTDTNSAISTGISTYSTTVNGNTLSIQEQHESVDGIQGKYSVKIDNNGNVAGFGLVSTANTGVPTTGTGSAFIIAADRFAISADYNTSETALNSVDKYPFKVFTVNTTVNGETIPPGVYIKDAYIHDAQITDAKIQNATITSAKIVGLEAGKITSGNIQINNANNIAIYQGKTAYTSNTNGFWLGNKNGYGSFHLGSSTSYLKFDGGGTAGLEASGLEILASDGTALVRAGGLLTGSGNNLLYNGHFRYGLDGWDVGVGQTVTANTSAGTLVTDATEYFQQNVAKVPVTEGEPLYVYGEFGGSGAYCSVLFYKEDGTTYTASTISANTWSPSAASSVAFRTAKFDVPTAGSGDPYTYAVLRFGTVTGQSATTWHLVGVSKVPPVIDSSYASTYIRDLAVDTLQIANDAITVPDSQNFVAPSSAIQIGTSSSSWTECVRMPVDWGSGWQSIRSVLMHGRQRFAGVLGSQHQSGMQEAIYMRLNRIDASGSPGSPRGQVWQAIDRPGRTVNYVTFAEFPAPVQQTENYIIEAYATYSGTASQGYWTREQAGIVLQASKK